MKIIPDYGDVRESSVRAKYAYLEAGVSAVGNIAIAALKIFIGLLIGSFSIMADAIHTLSDVGTSIVVAAGITAAKKEPDEEHPFGHGRYEHISALIISIVLLVVGARLLIASVEKFWNPDNIVFDGQEFAVYIILIVTMLAKEAMARYGLLLGRKIDSKMVEADAWHHRADSVTTAGVIVAMFLVQMGYKIADPALGAGISLYIIVESLKLSRSSMNLIIGTAGDRDVIRDIESAVRGVDGVEDVHDTYIHDYGSRRIVSMHVTAGCTTTTEVSHALATTIEDVVENMLTYSEAIIHIEPGGGECSRDLERVLVRVLKNTPGIVTYHSTRLVVDSTGPHITVHAIVDADMTVEESHELVHDIDRRVKETHPEARVDVHVEPCDKACGDCAVCETGKEYVVAGGGGEGKNEAMGSRACEESEKAGKQ